MLAEMVRLIKIPCFSEDNGELLVLEGGSLVPFAIARIFVVRGAPNGAVRGQHAHKQCTQLLTCPNGSVEVICNDGDQTLTFILDKPDLSLLVLPGVWLSCIMRTAGSVFTVLCDRPYEEHDYIRDYDAFKRYKQGESVKNIQKEK